MLVLVAYLAAHALIAQIVPSPWWVPDLTLVGLIFTVARSPRHWLALSVLAGLFTLAGTVRFPGPIFMSYLVLGWIVQWLAGHWDVTDARVQYFMTGLASLAMTFGALWLDGLWSWPLVGLASVHVALTGFTAMGLRHLSVSG